MLGAGFSSDAGVPTMKNFIDGVIRAREACGTQKETAVLTRALNFATLQRENNIEKLLARAVNSTAFFDLIWAFGLTVNQLSLEFLRQCRSGKEMEWYDAFAKTVCRSKAHILSFNYDLIMEQVLWWRTGCGVDYGLSFDEVRPQTAAGAPRHMVPLFKLHGSVSFLWCLNCHYTVNRYSHTVADAYEETSCPRCCARLVPLLIPPTYRKAVAYGSVLYGLWARADKLFATAERLVVGGLSFSEPDADFRQRFLQGLEKNKKIKEVIIINHDPDTCRSIACLLPSGMPCRFVFSFADFCEGN